MYVKQSNHDRSEGVLHEKCLRKNVHSVVAQTFVFLGGTWKLQPLRNFPTSELIYIVYIPVSSNYSKQLKTIRIFLAWSTDTKKI